MSTHDLKAHRKTRTLNGTAKKKEAGAGGVFALVTVVTFLLIFTYMSLNLKNIDFGYELQELTLKKTKLNEEIDRLKSEKARLLNLKRVEQLVINKLGYQYPEPDQFIKVYVEE